MTVLYFITKFIDLLGENQNTLMHNLYFFNLESKNENCNLHSLNEMTMCLFKWPALRKRFITRFTFEIFVAFMNRVDVSL